MEKIQIQFKESDYKVYYDYCESYYQIHDITRKQSILTFLDLYVKGILPVGEHDIQNARQILARKCQDLRSGASEDASGATRDLRVQACTDILQFCDDLEKMYRLHQKQGLVANYLVILGTFSRVIEAFENLSVAGKYNLDPAAVESLAQPLAGIIRDRLGTERQWQAVLHELCAVTARFNRISSGPKFDLDILKLIAPAVVAHFSKSIDPRQILSALPSEYDDCELEEFESLLNRTPDSLQEELFAAVNWDSLKEPLGPVAESVTRQRERWVQERANLAGPGALYPSAGKSPGISGVPSGSGAVAPSGQKVFDIDVSREGSTRVETPLKVSSAAEPAGPAEPKMAPHIPILIGVGVILLFIIVAVVLSGAWNPLAAGNSTPAVNSTVKTPTPAAAANATKTTAKPTATPAKNATAKPTPTAAKTTVPVTVTTTAAPKTYSSADIGAHLVEIAFGPDNNVIIKPKKDLISLSASGDLNDKDLSLLNDFIAQFNTYSSSTKISTSINANSAGDISLVFLPESSLRQISADSIAVKSIEVGSDSIRFIQTRDGKTYVNSEMNGITRYKWILRAVLLNLGFYGESSKYTDSIFYAGSDSATKLNEIDLKALQLMYGKKVINGMTKAQVKTLY